MFRRRVLVRQADMTDCAAACLAMVSRTHGIHMPLGRIRELVGTDRQGTSLYGLVEGAERLGFSASAFSAQYDELETAAMPLVAHVKIKSDLMLLLHYVVVYEVGKKGVLVADPGEMGLKWLSRQEFEEIWRIHKDPGEEESHGVILMLEPTENLASGGENAKNWRRFIALLKPNSYMIFESLIASLFFTVLGLSLSTYIQTLVDTVLVHQDLRLLNWLSVGMLGVVFFQAFFGAFKGYLLLHIGRKMDLSLILGYYRHLLSLPQKFFDLRHVGEILSRIEDAVKIREALSGATLSIVVDAALVVVTLGIIFLTSPSAALLGLGFLFLLFLYGLGFHFPTRRIQRALMERNAVLKTHMVEAVSGARTLKLFTAERRSLRKTEVSFVETLHEYVRLGTLGLFLNSGTTLIQSLGALGVLWVGGRGVIDGELTIGQLMSLHTLMGLLLAPAQRLSGVNVTIQNALIAADRLGDVLDLEREKAHEEGKERPVELKGDISLSNVRFRYGTREDVIRDLSVVIPGGRTTAFVGPSGSGKTTLVNLVPRLYPVAAGKVSIGNLDVNEIHLDTLRHKIGVVSQDTFLFSGSLKDNVAIGRLGASLGEIKEACRASGLEAMLKDLDAGLDTLVGENGRALSGGEKQRVAIARALLRDPDILIFDEATSHLDSLSEAAIQETILAERHRRTILLVAHRLSTVLHADKIVVMEKGRVVQEGTHDSLRSVEGLYKQLWDRQKGDGHG